MRRILVCALYPGSFVAESSTEDALIDRDGANFAAWYRNVFQERQDLVPDYVAALREVIDGFRGIRLEKVVLLCEDSQQEAFARRFLVRAGWHPRALRVEKSPQGRGSGEQWVRDRFPVGRSG